MPHLLGAVAKAQFSRFENKILKKKLKLENIITLSFKTIILKLPKNITST